MQEWIRKVKLFIWDHFHLHDDTEEIDTIVSSIKRGVYFKGTNLWILIFAIFIASIGLNVNSTAVIIGAMLISPLMGPIIGFGLGMGIYDFELVKKSIKNLLIAVFISLITSTLYFLITPFRDAQSELLARTEPNTYDVLIALFGGLSGIIAATRKEKTNVIPGVAIATALMPPLCTVGYGIANGEWSFATGAFYLFFINSVFISLAALLMVRFLDFPKKGYISPKEEAKAKSIILLITVLTILPSIYFAYTSFLRNSYRNNARTFVQNEMIFSNGQIIDSKFFPDKKLIELVYVGEKIDSLEIEKRLINLKKYNLSQTECTIKQVAISNPNQREEIKSAILEDLKFNSGQNLSLEQRIAELENKNHFQDSLQLLIRKKSLSEAKNLIPEIETITISQSWSEENKMLDSTISVSIITQKKLTGKEEKLLKALLIEKLEIQKINLVQKLSNPNKPKKQHK